METLRHLVLARCSGPNPSTRPAGAGRARPSHRHQRGRGWVWGGVAGGGGAGGRHLGSPWDAPARADWRHRRLPQNECGAVSWRFQGGFMGGFMVLVQFVAKGRVEGSWAVRRRSRLRRHFWSFWGDGAVSYPVSWSVSGSGFMAGFMG